MKENTKMAQLSANEMCGERKYLGIGLKIILKY